MTEYHTDSFSTASKINTLKSSCKAIGAEIARQIISVITDFETVAYVLETVALKLYNITADKAEQLYRDAWHRMQYTGLAKRLWSERELAEWINKNTKTGKIKRLSESLGAVCRLLKELKKYIDKAEPVIKVIEAAAVINSHQKYTVQIQSEKLERSSVLRMEMREGVRKFEAMMQIINVINSYSPRGFQEYIRYNIAVFEQSKKLFQITESYSEVIADLARKTKSLWNRAMENRHSVWNAMIALRINADVNSYLDRLEKEVDQKLKREYDKYKDEIKRHCY